MSEELSLEITFKGPALNQLEKLQEHFKLKDKGETVMTAISFLQSRMEDEKEGWIGFLKHYLWPKKKKKPAAGLNSPLNSSSRTETGKNSGTGSLL